MVQTRRVGFLAPFARPTPALSCGGDHGDEMLNTETTTRTETTSPPPSAPTLGWPLCRLRRRGERGANARDSLRQVAHDDLGLEAKDTVPEPLG